MLQQFSFDLKRAVVLRLLLHVLSIVKAAVVLQLLLFVVPLWKQLLFYISCYLFFHCESSCCFTSLVICPSTVKAAVVLHLLLFVVPLWKQLLSYISFYLFFCCESSCCFTSLVICPFHACCSRESAPPTPTPRRRARWVQHVLLAVTQDQTTPAQTVPLLGMICFLCLLLLGVAAIVILIILLLLCVPNVCFYAVCFNASSCSPKWTRSFTCGMIWAFAVVQGQVRHKCWPRSLKLLHSAASLARWI